MPECRFIGVLEIDMSHGVRGWVLDKEVPGTSLQVEISFDDSYYCRTFASIPRKNLWRGMHGPYGFEVKLVDLPSVLFDQPIRTIRAVLVNGQFELQNSPLTFNPVSVAGSLSRLMCADLKSLHGS